MTDIGPAEAMRRRTLSVRGWFALAAISTFVMVVLAVVELVAIRAVAKIASPQNADFLHGLK